MVYVSVRTKVVASLHVQCYIDELEAILKHDLIANILQVVSDICHLIRHSTLFRK
jgi:hypothetical protein